MESLSLFAMWQGGHGVVAVVPRCELPELDASQRDAFQELYLGKAAVVLRGWAAGQRWRTLKRLFARTKLFGRHGTRSVRPSDMHRGCGLALGARKNRTSVFHAATAGGGGCCYLQPHHRVAECRAPVPTGLDTVQLHGPSVSIGGRGSTAILHRHEEAWMAQIYGKKLWLVGGPGPALAPDVLRHPCRRGFRSTLTPLTLQTQQETLSLSRCITGPSDILYLPDGWAHATCGLSTFNVGLGYIGSVGFLPPLHRAAVVGDLPTVSKRLEVEGISVLEPAGGGMLNEAGLPPLHWAAWNGHVEVMRKLIEWEQQAASLHIPSLASALRWAAARGHSSATAFLAKEIGPDVRDEQGASPLHWAATTGHVPVMKELLKLKADPNAADAFGARPLHFLAGEGHLAAMRLLIANKASVDVKDSEGVTTAHAAAQFGHHRLLEILSLEGASIDRTTLTFIAKAAGHAAVCTWLEQNR